MIFPAKLLDYMPVKIPKTPVDVVSAEMAFTTHRTDGEVTPTLTLRSNRHLAESPAFSIRTISANLRVRLRLCGGVTSREGTTYTYITNTRQNARARS